MIARSEPISPDPAEWPQILPFQPTEAGGPDPGELITLRHYYDGWIYPEIVDVQSANSLKEDRTALNHWEHLTDNPDIRSVGRDDLRKFRDALNAAGLRPATINKTWRELRTMFAEAADQRFISAVPRIAKGMKCSLVREPAKIQRESVTFAEIESLWRGCAQATYPAHEEFPAPKLWRVAIVLFTVYGARTLDIFQRLNWDNIRFGDRLIRFEAMKTRKLQGLPLTDLVIKHLRSIRGRSQRLFRGFNSRGNRLKGTIKRGYYTTWNWEIGAAAIDPPIWLKNLRESMLTRYNGIEPGLGNWIAAHHVPGVSAQHYDLPTQRIRDAIEASPVPDCFSEIQD
ncbi:MAG: tyrosine-type recombinase/integrase [Planctomycetaceae bacterium]